MAIDREIEMKFSVDWTSPYVEVWSRALAEFKDRSHVSYLEVGLYEGRTLFWMFSQILTHPTATATAIDIKISESFYFNLEKHSIAERLQLIEGASGLELRKFAAASFEIIYVDASHLAKNVLTDAILAWQLLKVGGILIFDDYLWHSHGTLPIDMHPKFALDAFLSVFGNELDIIERGYQLILKKKASPCSDRCDQCSAFMGHHYSWNILNDFYANECTPAGLFKVINGEKVYVHLDSSEIELLKKILLGKKIGEAVASVPEKIEKSKPFQKLLARLKMN